MKIAYAVTDAAKWAIDTGRDASEFDAGYLWDIVGEGVGRSGILPAMRST